MIEIKQITDLKTVSKIVHCADIHVRNLRRHTEYREQFARFYKSILDVKDENTIIYVGGDIVHTKTEMSPELIDLVSEFLSSLADIAPTIVITGNHDANLNNPDRLDALSPIISNLAHKNLFYLKDTGLYKIGDVIFSVFSIFDTPDKYILAEQIPGIETKIALFHGPVTNSSTDIGYNIHSSTDVKIFDGFDYALLGDIHLLQYLNESKTIAYCSSLIQQNFGESYENHGYLLWDLKSKNSTFHQLDTNYGYHTLFISNNEVVKYNKSLITDKSRVRVKISNSTDEFINSNMATIKRELGVSDISRIRVDGSKSFTNIDLIKESNLDIRNTDTQNKLIHDYLNLTLNLSLDDDLIQKIYDINKKTNLLFHDKEEVIRNIIWKPKRFEFSNMFSYGENNFVNFDNFRGIQGLFGPNASGKSSLLDALCFCLFDTTSRAFKADQILNTKKDRFSCKFNFEIDGVDYFIEKTAVKGPNSKVKVNISFYSVNKEGIVKNLNGEQRRDTNAIIKSYIGTYEDFTLMCLSIQNNNTNFVDKSQTERKEILAKFLDLNIFETLYDIANQEYKRILTLIENENYHELELQLTDQITKTNTLRTELAILENEIGNLRSDILDINEIIIRLSKDITPVTKFDIDSLSKQHSELYMKIQKQKNEISEARDKFQHSDKIYSAAELELNSIDRESLQTELSIYNSKSDELSKLESDIRQLTTVIGSKNDKLKKLEVHEYDPDCVYCMNNVFVKDAIQTKSEIESDKYKLAELLSNKEKIEKYLSSKSYVIKTKNDLDAQKIEVDKLYKIRTECEIQVLTLQNSLGHTQLQLNSIENQIAEYNRNKASIKKNILIESDIAAKRLELDALESKLSINTALQMTAISDIKLGEFLEADLEKRIAKTKSLILDKAAYEYYLQCVDKDGISYQLISKILPKIEMEVNNILNNLVDFRIVFNTDGKNVNAFLVYNDLYWPLELSSGMERFISAIAIRVALINVSSLPRPTFFAIDEGLGVLDSTNLNQIYLLFNYIREIFQFTLIISHIDIVRDMVDHTLTVEVSDGLSKLELN